jgi:acetyl-CoA carboxylase biotin carboxyl carrier protein
VTAHTSNEPDPLLEASGLSEADLAAVLELVAGTDVVELELTVGASRVTLRRPPGPGTSPVPTVSRPATRDENSPLAIVSPLVGVFHAAVEVGDTVSHGQVIGAIEALGMPTSVDAPQEGTVEQLLVPDGNPVEYGQPLLLLRRSNSG